MSIVVLASLRKTVKITSLRLAIKPGCYSRFDVLHRGQRHLDARLEPQSKLEAVQRPTAFAKGRTDLTHRLSDQRPPARIGSSQKAEFPSGGSGAFPPLGGRPSSCRNRRVSASQVMLETAVKFSVCSATDPGEGQKESPNSAVGG